jgi:hypothetical protein
VSFFQDIPLGDWANRKTRHGWSLFWSVQRRTGLPARSFDREAGSGSDPEAALAAQTRQIIQPTIVQPNKQFSLERKEQSIALAQQMLLADRCKGETLATWLRGTEIHWVRHRDVKPRVSHVLARCRRAGRARSQVLRPHRSASSQVERFQRLEGEADSAHLRLPPDPAASP